MRKTKIGLIEVQRDASKRIYVAFIVNTQH